MGHLKSNIIMVIIIVTILSCNKIDDKYYYEYNGMFGKEFYSVELKEDSLNYFLQEYTYDLDSSFNKKNTSYKRLIKGKIISDTIIYNSYLLKTNSKINNCWSFEELKRNNEYNLCIGNIVYDTIFNNLQIEELIIYELTPFDMYTSDASKEKIFFDKKRKIFLYIEGYLDEKVYYTKTFIKKGNI
jgi:hypothetical protein|tara:strand:+ start:316 stop:873 length:558 start_codon:yes stop_codon:yes gene_type:complete